MDDKEKNQENKFEFVTETIKKRPINKGKIARKILNTIFLALVFGVVSSLTIAAIYPLIYGYLNPEKESEIQIPVSEESQDEPIEEFVPTTDDEAAVSETDNSNEKAADEKGEDESKEVIVNQVVETIEKDLDLDDFRMLYRKISSVGNSVLKSVVKVSVINDATDWFSNQYEDNTVSSGVIIADNGKELLIAVESDIIDEAKETEVTFFDGRTCSCLIKESDKSTGIAVLSVNRRDIDESTLSKIETASFGSVSNIMSGTPILAIGSPQGLSDSMALGQITSLGTVDITDGNIRVISTDIYASTSASGVIANLNGNVLGIVCHEDMGLGMPNLIRAYSIIDIKDRLEKLSNGQSLAMLGIVGTDVTESAANDLGVPIGTYVKKVIMDSPAMNAGLRSGDVITKFNGREITTLNDYKDSVLKSHPDETVIVTVMRPGRDSYTEVNYEITLKDL